ncbi:TPA: hypothetical protein TV065_001841, partial [Streptococcus equi subsp. equi]|nr:hypothetical protein [Streptococcus equi subsp. equi]HEK9281013.1 hypothetical protein [Streptococcus equi subsp. equi]HEK9381997.1 hypothetical protein [Streptococcus equi subsp. equi]HEK9387487.1 hypothetical protein [Streptococcus equi subsp. equi]HEK9403117.1 hypothetical protein [Streptococcus equi subsp. equi]
MKAKLKGLSPVQYRT